VPHDCTDGFFGAYWRRPEAYLDPGACASISGLARLDETVVRPAIERLAADLPRATGIATTDICARSRRSTSATAWS